nr:reverse transcriptase domain-containing protein [Tanacetum cinerariifolium]
MDEIQIHKFWQMFKQLHINITLADALILIPKYQKMLKALLSNNEKLLELANTPLNENCSAVILKKLLEKLGDPRKFHILYDLFATNHLSGNPTFSFHIDFTSPGVNNPLSSSTTSSSSNHLLKEFVDELALITFPPRNDDLPFDIESDLREIEYFLNRDPTKEMDSILKDLIDEEFKLLIDELDPPRLSDFLLSPEYDSFLFKDFSEVDVLPSTDNEDKVFNPGILIHENLSEVTVQVTLVKNVKKISISNASLILEDFDPPLSDHKLPFHKKVPGSETLLSFSPENEEKVFKPGILTSKGVHTSLLLKSFHWGPKAFKVIKFFKIPMEIFPFSYREEIHILDVPCLHFYP